MISLHDTSEDIKEISKWGGILIATIVTVVLLFKVGGNIKEVFWPTQKPGPTVCFDKLPDINFPQNNVIEKFNYIIDTKSGNLPSFPDRVNIYDIIQPTPNFLDLSRAQEKTSRIGFREKGSLISDTLYRWTEETAPFREIKYDILSLDFSFTSNFMSDPDVLSGNPDESSSIPIAQSFLSDLNSFPIDIDMAKTKTTLLSISNSELIPAEKPSVANIIRVDFYPKDVDNTPLFFTHPPYSLINVLISDRELGTKIVEVNFSHKNLGTKSCTYPIKTADKAFLELKSQKAYLASFPETGKEIPIKDAFLAYYVSENPQKYLIPVIVFRGEGFYAYVRAITDEWISK
ncbi:MAG: hypothetical protein Q7K55_02150 [Candidatus Levybacteria bacterium]|nr:hypothetical protein [Candidatus Levybacteria bacterium]